MPKTKRHYRQACEDWERAYSLLTDRMVICLAEAADARRAAAETARAVGLKQSELEQAGGMIVNMRTNLNLAHDEIARLTRLADTGEPF